MPEFEDVFGILTHRSSGSWPEFSVPLGIHPRHRSDVTVILQFHVPQRVRPNFREIVLGVDVDLLHFPVESGGLVFDVQPPGAAVVAEFPWEPRRVLHALDTRVGGIRLSNGSLGFQGFPRCAGVERRD